MISLSSLSLSLSLSLYRRLLLLNTALCVCVSRKRITRSREEIVFVKRALLKNSLSSDVSGKQKCAFFVFEFIYVIKARLFLSLSLSLALALVSLREKCARISSALLVSLSSLLL